MEADRPLDVLSRVRPLLEPALAYCGGTHEWGDVADGILAGRLQLWPGERAALVTELQAYPRKRVVHVFLAGGELEDVLAFQPSLDAWARAQGATGLTMTGRPGWARVLPGLGWARAGTTMARGIA